MSTSSRGLIDPSNVTDFDRDDFDLETFAIFCVCVAGKKAEQQAEKLATMLEACPEDKLPLRWLTEGDRERTKDLLRQVKIGQYERISRCLHELAALDLRTCTRRELTEVFGISLKTASFFLLHSRANTHCVVLDTHVLRWLRRFEWDREVPPASPSDEDEYRYWSEQAASIMRRQFGYHVPMATIDLSIWKYMRQNPVERLENELKKHDWYYHYSDDNRVWRSGSAHWQEIQRCLAEVDEKVGQELLEKYRPNN